MSDFDREAEREKLREKYERDKKKREASERMSELLLQGATMTNRHCPECHSPVFRYDGREFCPTCEKEIAGERDGKVEAEEERSEMAEAESEPSAGDDSELDRSEPDDDDERVERGGEDDEGTDRTPAADDTLTPAGERRPARVQPPVRREAEEKRNEGPAGDRDRGGESSDAFRDAEASLKREIQSLTRRAEETRDLGRKRDLLAAAREAAETLRAVRRL